MDVNEQLAQVDVVPAVRTVLVQSQDLLDENAKAIRDLKRRMTSDAASRDKLLAITANLAKIKAMYDQLLSDKKQ